MQITKTTENFASKRGIELVMQDGDLWIFESSQDCEPMVIYTESSDGLHFKGNVYLEQSVKEELPAWIRDEKHLRELIKFIAAAIH